MAEPSTTTLAVVTTASIGLSSLFPGIDGNALIGAFAGASLVAVTSKDLNIVQRLAYMVISLAIGYLAAPEMLKLTPLNESGVASFIVAAIAIACVTHSLDLIKKIELPAWFQKGEPRE